MHSHHYRLYKALCVVFIYSSTGGINTHIPIMATESDMSCKLHDSVSFCYIFNYLDVCCCAGETGRKPRQSGFLALVDFMSRQLSINLPAGRSSKLT